MTTTASVMEDSHRAASPNGRPLTIGVFGGSFNPIHLGHALLAISTQQTKPVDSVVLVPVFRHAVKRDLLPFEDRVEMCKLAVEQSSSIVVSTIEQEVGESNGAMLRALKQQYPENTKFLWICGDDFFRWMERPKGLETLQEVSGLIVQRRLHKTDTEDRFFKEPIDEGRIRGVAARLNLSIDFIYGELPHFSSTLVRRAPGHWRSFLPQSVIRYLDERPHLLEKLHANLEADAKKEQETTLPSTVPTDSVAAACVMRGLDCIHALQMERGRTGLWLSMQSREKELKEAQANTDALIQEILQIDIDDEDSDEVLALAEELKQIPVWLERDRQVVKRRAKELVDAKGVEGWTRRLALLEKFNPRVDVLIGTTIRALSEILGHSEESRDLAELLWKWCEGKEALGRLRAFVCAGGPSAPMIVKSSLDMRERLHQRIEIKERSMARVMSLQYDTRLAVPDALHRMLEEVTHWEWSLMGCFASSTPLALVHKLLADEQQTDDTFDVEPFFEASSSAIDLMLSFVKALAAAGCATA